MAAEGPHLVSVRSERLLVRPLISCVSRHASCVTLVRVARQVLKDSVATRQKLSTGCKFHEGTLKDLDMPFKVSHSPASSSPLPPLPHRSRPLPHQISFPGGSQARALLLRDLQRDVSFFERANIMDYSLFIAFKCVAVPSIHLPPPLLSLFLPPFTHPPPPIRYHELSDTTGSEDVISNPSSATRSRPSSEDPSFADSFKFHRGPNGGCLVQVQQHRQQQ